jgi:hypothetical protein
VTAGPRGPVISLMLAVPDGFLDPFGHLWLVGDRSPLNAHDPP